MYPDCSKDQLPQKQYFYFYFRMNPIRELISQWGQWDLNPSIKWDQLIFFIVNLLDYQYNPLYQIQKRKIE